LIQHTYKIEELNSAWLYEQYFFGIPLIDPDGNKISDKVAEFAIAQAIGQLENDLMLYIRQRDNIEERHDYDLEIYSNFCFLQLWKRPIRAITSFTIMYGNNTVEILDNAWIIYQAKMGIMQLYPGTIVSSTGMYFSGLWPMLHWQAKAPMAFKLIYNAGFDDIPAQMAHAIGMLASIHLFNILGDLVIGAGIASMSIGMDGWSQSIGTTASAENSAYSARIIMYQKELYGYNVGSPGLIDRLKTEYEIPSIARLG